MIEARGLVKRYGSTMAVNDLPFSIRPGMVTGFLGPNGAFATARRRVRQVAFDYCAAAPDREAYERLVVPMMIGLADAPRALPGPAAGSAAAEALIDGIVLRKLLCAAPEPDRASGHHLETFRHGIWGLDRVGSCAGRLDPGHGHGWLVASISKMLAAYHRWDGWVRNGTDLSDMAGLETFATGLAEAGDITAARPAAKIIVQLRRRQVHSYGSRYETALATSLHRLAAACEQAGDIRRAGTYRAEATALTRWAQQQAAPVGCAVSPAAAAGAQQAESVALSRTSASPLTT